MVETTFTSDIFPVEEIELDGTVESFLAGGRHLFPLLPKALRGVEEIAVIGWGSQGPAQALNLRDSLSGTGIKVSVGLRQGSSSFNAARRAGFTEADDTLGDMFELIGRADMVLLLISDAAQAALYPQVFDALQSGATLGLSHGFLVGHLEAVGGSFPSDVNVVGVCPKGMGPSVRRLYEQGASSTVPASTRALRSNRTSTAGPPTWPSRGRSASVRRIPSRRPWAPSTAPTSSVSEGSCWGRSTASSRASIDGRERPASTRRRRSSRRARRSRDR